MSKPLLVLATRNAKKCGEMVALLAPQGVEVRSLDHYPRAPEIEETGATFAENAALKAAGVKLALEPLNRFETYFLNRSDQALALAAEVDLVKVVGVDLEWLALTEAERRGPGPTSARRTRREPRVVVMPLHLVPARLAWMCS